MKVLLVDQIAKTNFNNTFSLAKRLAGRGVDLQLVIDQQSDYVDDLERRGIQVHRLFKTDEKDIGRKEKLGNYIAAWREIENMMRSNHYDILHIQWVILSPLDWWFLRKIKRKYGIRIVDTVHDILPFNEHSYDMRFYRKIYRLADSIVVQAQANVDRFARLFPECVTKLSMVPLGNFNDYVSPGEGSAIAKKWGIGKDDLVFLFVGQIKKAKGLDVLLDAFDAAHRGRGNMKLVIAGNPWKDDFGEYRSRIEEINSEGPTCIYTDIRFIPDDELGNYFDLANVVVLPYRDIYQSGVVRLTYAYGKPVIATRLPAFEEVVRDEETGWLCEAASVSDLADALVKAWEQKSRLSSMGSRGRRYVGESYSWDAIAKAYLIEYGDRRPTD